MTSSSTITPSFLIIADSHGKCLKPTIITPHYCIKTYSISGLQWSNKYDHNLSLFSLMQTNTFASLISTTSNILFLVGTNSVRHLPATDVIQQIDQFLLFLFSHYCHLKQGNIIITTCLPCLKPSTRYSNISFLNDNIDHYNHLLLSLTTKHKFYVLDLHLSFEWLGSDRLHIDYIYRHQFATIILNYINNMNLNQNVSAKVSTRSRESVSVRNRKRNLKIKQIQRNFTLIRDTSSAWPYKHIKDFLKHNNVRFGRLSILSNHKLHLHFNNLSQMIHADQVLTINTFNYDNFFHWIHHN